jgi:NagD protein
LEYATGASTEVVGKPTSTFFHTLLKGLSIAAEDAVMVGDSLTNDISGAQEIGMTAVLVLSGKTTREALENSPVTPDLVLLTADELTTYL